MRGYVDAHRLNATVWVARWGRRARAAFERCRLLDDRVGAARTVAGRARRAPDREGGAAASRGPTPAGEALARCYEQVTIGGFVVIEDCEETGAGSSRVPRQDRPRRAPRADRARRGRLAKVARVLEAAVEIAVEPAIRAAGAKRVVEIGALRGETTVRLLDLLGPESELHVIDPVPQFDPDEHERRFPGRYVFHRDISHNVLPELPPVDAALIDGDHNWYTVYNELRAARRGRRARPARRCRC